MLYSLGLQRADDEAGTVNVSTITAYVLGVEWKYLSLGDPRKTWGSRQQQTPGWVRQFVVHMEPNSVKAGTWDFGDREDVERFILEAPHLWIIAEGTNLPRASTARGNAWTDETSGLLLLDESDNPIPYKVVRKSGPDAAVDYASGQETTTFTLEAELPNV